MTKGRLLVTKLAERVMELLYEHFRDTPSERYFLTEFEENLIEEDNWRSEDVEAVILYLMDKNYIDLRPGHYKNDSPKGDKREIHIKAKLIDFYEKKYR